MNRSTGESVTVPSDALAALRSASSSQALQPDDGATIAYQRVKDTASRVLDQLDGLTSSLEKSAGSGHKPVQEEHADEECLESYLQRYMQQLTGKKQEPAVTATAPTQQQAEETSAEEIKQPPRQPAQAPEDRLQITAMRELANDSARRAVAASNNSQLFDKTGGSYLMTKIVSLVSMVLVVSYFWTHSTMALTSGTATFGVALLSACRFALLCRTNVQSGEAPA